MSIDKELTQYANDKNYGVIKSNGGYQLIYNGRVNPQIFKTKLLAVIYLGSIK
jgi:phosphotransferase system IIB component